MSASINIKPSKTFPVKGAISPQSVAAAGSAVSGWIAAKDGLGHATITALLGVLGGGVCSVDILQATDNAGTNAKALSTGVLANLATNNSQAQYDFRPHEECDIGNGFEWFQVKINVVGGTGSLVGAAVTYGPQRWSD